MSDKIELDVEIDPNKCTATINLYDVFASLSDAEREKIVKNLAWEAPIVSALQEDIYHEYATETYYPEIHKFRTDILTSSEAPEMIRKWAETMVYIVNQEKVKTKEATDRYWKSYNNFRSKFASFDTSHVFDFDTRIDTAPTDKETVENILEMMSSALLKKLREAEDDAARLAAEYEAMLRETAGVFWEDPCENSPALIAHKMRIENENI